MIRLIVVLSVLEVTIGHKQLFPVGEQPLSLNQIKRLKAWTENDPQNIWELSGQFEGDIILTPNQRNGLLNQNRRWPKNEIPYEIDPLYTASQRQKIVDALKQYENTNVRTRPRRSNDTDYVFVNSVATGCSSYIGRLGNRQDIKLASGCLSPGTIVHEFLHAFGFYHQQSATERDDFVTINWDNIETGKENNFVKYGSNIITSYGEMYDYGSVMHYSKTAFSHNGQPTIVPRDPNAQIGQRIGLSGIDIKKVNKMYPASLK